MPAKNKEDLLTAIEISQTSTRKQVHVASTKKAESAKQHKMNSKLMHKRDEEKGIKHSPFKKSIIEKIRAFENKVPSRFKSKPDPPSPFKPLSVTHPVEFSFASRRINNGKQENTTTTTTHSVDTTSSNNNRKEFKARKLNKEILSHAVGIPRVAKKPATKVQEFNLSRGVQSKRKSSAQIVKEVKTKAKQLNAAMVAAVHHSGVPLIKPREPTRPESPKLHTARRAAVHVEQQKNSSSKLQQFQDHQ